MQALAESDSTTSTSFYISKATNAKGESIGNGFFAGRDHEAGNEITILRRPLVGSLDSQYLEDTCANCYVWTEGASTGTRLYACQKEAWNRGHKHECKSLHPLIGKDMPKAVLACMKLLIRRKYGLISDDEWEKLCQLPTHVDDFKQSGTYENIELMAMGAGQFSLTQNMFNKDFVAAMYMRVLTNSLTLITPSLDPLGLMLDPTLGYINHSCEPNAFVLMDGPSVSLRTLRPIKTGEECQKGVTLDEDRWAREPRNLAKKVKDVADAIIAHEPLAQYPANYVGDSRDEQRVAAIQGKAFAEYAEAQRAQDPEEVIHKIEDAMRLCHQSGLWPVYRQPYAALRDDLIVNLLSMGKYPIAWAQCAKRYKHILPKLYPSPFHPTRVVQTWQMAALAVYLAGDPEGIGAPGVNMGLIAMMLVKQVLDASSMSHGSNSAFARSVRGKAEEMTEELRRSLGGSPDTEVVNHELEVQRDMLMEMGEWIKI
ncbi:hypothetical protein EK21DRAFT_53752 [Setomelanomma holmii]|uniref:SET domain-containing protein n=1 Tax=Setomelanomma holmii TaxID=210430 RepID=A0A9P4HKB1_9PLEO|nr:hypothetical protein EK21DRAFT_53752 [Setomelanomma holmii]